MLLRSYLPETDQALILDSWCEQARAVQPVRGLDGGGRQAHREVVQRLVERAPPLVACHPQHPAQIYGWACAQPRRRLLHMVYVRSAWRQQGVATRLMQELFSELGTTPIYLTHHTRAAPYHHERWQLQYAPHLVGLEDTWR